LNTGTLAQVPASADPVPSDGTTPAHPGSFRCAARPTGRAFFLFGRILPAIVARRRYSASFHQDIRHRPAACGNVSVYFLTTSQEIFVPAYCALLSLAILPPGLPTGSKADASFEATGEQSAWPLPFGDFASAIWQ
jgi:hypothetical protein